MKNFFVPEPANKLITAIITDILSPQAPVDSISNKVFLSFSVDSVADVDDVASHSEQKNLSPSIARQDDEDVKDGSEKD